MILLDKKDVSRIKSLFKDVHGASWMISRIEKDHIGKIYADSTKDIHSVMIETESSEYFFGGSFDQSFLEEAIHHILNDIIPNDPEKIGFFYAATELWKSHLIEILKPYRDQRLGSQFLRRFYKLNMIKYNQMKRAMPELSSDYAFEFIENNQDIIARISYNDEEVCFCKDNGRALGIMDLDLFTHPIHRKKGLAQYASIQMIDYCLEHHIIPQWGCWSVNVPSNLLAQKLGFELNGEEQVIFANFNNPS